MSLSIYYFMYTIHFGINRPLYLLGTETIRLLCQSRSNPHNNHSRVLRATVRAVRVLASNTHRHIVLQFLI